MKNVKVKDLDFIKNKEVLEDEKTGKSIITGEIDTEVLSDAFLSILKDAEKCNKGFGAAGRRFRLNTVALEKAFLEMRAVSPVK